MSEIPQKRCNTCRLSRTMPDLRLHVYCREEGAPVPAFKEVCDLYDDDTRKLNRGWSVEKRLLNLTNLTQGGFTDENDKGQ